VQKSTWSIYLELPLNKNRLFEGMFKAAAIAGLVVGSMQGSRRRNEDTAGVEIQRTLEEPFPSPFD